jgi:GT2 family glycosyltransferase
VKTLRQFSPLTSVLIPTYNRQQLLLDALGGLLLQEYRPLEIIVYDQTPAISKELLNLADHHKGRIQYVRGLPAGLVSAYRRCVELSTGKLCLFVDDDVLITDPGFVAKHVNYYRDAGIGAVSGQVLHEGQYDISPSDPRAHGPFGWRFVRFDVNRYDPDLPSLCGANMSFRRDVYFQTGGFDPAYGGSGFRFETDFACKVKAAGYRVVFSPEASLVHRYRQKGGAENRFLLSLEREVDSWYTQFFANTWYFVRKWHPLPDLIPLFFHIWREHAFNKACMRAGIRFQVARHRALLRGMILGEKTNRRRRHRLREGLGA